MTAGLIHPPLALEKTYLNHRFEARVLANGKVIFNGQTHDTLSSAAVEARRTIKREGVLNTNGWDFWQFRDGDGRLKKVGELQQRYYERIKTFGR